MKTRISIPFSMRFAVSILVLTACHFSVGTKKDLRTGLSFRYNGFRVDNVFLVDSSVHKLPDNKVLLNSRVGFLVYGLSGFTLRDNKAFPGFTVDIMDKQGRPVVNQVASDLFAQDTGFSELLASALMGSIRIIPPLKAGETYHLKAHVWDKNNPENTLDAETDIVVK